MKKIIMIGVVLLVLGGGGAGAYFYFVRPAEASVDPNAPVDKKVEKKAEKEKGGHGEATEFVELDPLILPIIDAGGVTQTISLVIALEVPNSEAKAEVESLKPRLKDAYIQELYGMLHKKATMKGGVIQVSYLKKKLSTISTEVLGEDVVSDVLLQVIEQRPM